MYQCERAYAKIYLGRIEDNMEVIQKRLSPGTQMIGVVKADGYGHGAVAVAKIIDRFVVGYGVATMDEALQLRRHGIKKAVLVLGPVARTRYGELFHYHIRPCVFRYEEAKELSAFAALYKEEVRIHIAVDTGMSRIGLTPDRESAEMVRKIAALPGVGIEGMFTHFARADETDKTSAREQLKRFDEFAAMVKELGVTIPLCHCANSAGITDLPDSHLDAVRAGIMIYGLYPSDEVDRAAVPMEPAMEWKSTVTYIKGIAPGTPVSYGGTFVADQPMRIATVAVGYADGYPRSLSGSGSVLICGRRARILGRICMDQMMVDVTDIPEASEGSEVTLIGRDGGEEITMEEVAGLSGRFHYEIPCLISKRVPRVYVYRGREMGLLTHHDGCYEED